MANEPKRLPETRSLLVRAGERGAEEAGGHPLNPKSELHGHMLSRRTGLTRTGVNLLRVPPGRESYVFHLHWNEEEWAFVLAGRGAVEIGDDTFEIGPGDFMGFPPGTHPHHIRNTGAEDLVYLSGGENLPTDVGDFPRHGKRLVKVAGQGVLYSIADGKRIWPPEAGEGGRPG